MTFVAEMRRRETSDSSLVRIHAQSRAGLECPRARVPYTAGCEILLPTTMRGSAHQLKRARFLAAYDHYPTRTDARPVPRPTVPRPHPPADARKTVFPNAIPVPQSPPHVPPPRATSRIVDRPRDDRSDSLRTLAGSAGLPYGQHPEIGQRSRSEITS